jgi:hypothetical protein
MLFSGDRLIAVRGVQISLYTSKGNRAYFG